MAQKTNVRGPFKDANILRTEFASAMSEMYRTEVPLYGDLIKIVHDINKASVVASAKDELIADTVALRASAERLTLERHGAIRLGTPYELQTVKRIFSILGMHPFGYYDLSVAGLPMHATCFRPSQVSSLDLNPFRVFTTLLRPELLNSEEAKAQALALLGKRKIFTDRLLQLLDIAQSHQNQLSEEQAKEFIPEALLSFSWRPVAAATFEQFEILKNEHPILADIACFQSAHINHLTPRTLNISAVQEAMKAAGMEAKSRIEGPPRRKCPILLRQTSFLALEESIKFRKGSSENDAGLIEGNHKARFGEIEERGAAVTAKGRDLYDRLLSESLTKSVKANPEEAEIIFSDVFKQFPDEWKDLRQQGLIYSEFRCVKKEAIHSMTQDDRIPLLEQLISEGFVEASPITYEDFLPFSAAGIFQSNLQSSKNTGGGPELHAANADPSGFSSSLGSEPTDINSWYSQQQQSSLEKVAWELGFTVAQLV
jgi:uncharacterized glyoxalase superfamily metalloenzyme YdcJ